MKTIMHRSTPHRAHGSPPVKALITQNVVARRTEPEAAITGPFQVESKLSDRIRIWVNEVGGGDELR